MGVLWMRARAQLRGRVGASLFLALLVGLAGALVLAAAAGARRSEAALPRFLAANQTVDAAVYVPASSPSDDLSRPAPGGRPCPGSARRSGRPGGRRGRSSWPWPTPPTPPAGIDSSARPPWTRGAVWRSAVRSWSPAACPTSAGPTRWPSTRSWPSVATSA